MIKGTTPTIELLIRNRDLTGSKIVATFVCKQTKVEKTGNELVLVVNEGNSIVLVPFSQSDSLKLATGNADVQINWVDTNGNRFATETKSIDIKRNLHERVIPSE